MHTTVNHTANKHFVPHRNYNHTERKAMKSLDTNDFDHCLCAIESSVNRLADSKEHIHRIQASFRKITSRLKSLLIILPNRNLFV